MYHVRIGKASIMSLYREVKMCNLADLQEVQEYFSWQSSVIVQQLTLDE